MILEAEVVNDVMFEAEAVESTVVNIGKAVEIGSGLKMDGDVLSVDDVLTKFSQDDEGNLMYDGERIASVPSGGAEGQVLAKQSDEDYDYGWKNSVTLEYNSGVLSIF